MYQLSFLESDQGRSIQDNKTKIDRATNFYF